LVIEGWPCRGADLVDLLAQGSHERRVLVAGVPLLIQHHRVVSEITAFLTARS